MKKTININLGGHPFIIDQDAFDSLEQYLNALERHFRNHQGGEEIMEDIEIRIAELFAEDIKPNRIVSRKNVESVIATMGTVEAFTQDSEEDMHGETKSKSTYSNASSSYSTGKKLFRDEDRKVVAGVSSGLAAYFGIDNPWLIRLLFILFFGAGSPLVYIILWIAVSPARTSGDRLAMQGEPVNVANIVKTIEDEVMNLKDKIEDIGRDLSSKK